MRLLPAFNWLAPSGSKPDDGFAAHPDFIHLEGSPTAEERVRARAVHHLAANRN